MVRAHLGGVAAAMAMAMAMAGACYKPPATECVYECSPGDRCPSGLSCGLNGFCMVPGSGTVCDGNDGGGDDDGPLPDGDQPDGPMASRLYTKLAVGAHHACAIDVAGQLWCWGSNDNRQLGVTTAADYSATPVHVTGGPTGNGAWTAIAAGAYHTCGLWLPMGMTAPELYCWGQNFSYQTGTSTGTQTSPHLVTAPSGRTWKSIALGGAFTCAVTRDVAGATDELVCFGDNDTGQLGTAGGGMRSAPLPVDVSAVSPATVAWTSLTAGTDHACAVAMDGKAYCWGDNGDGQSGQVNAPFLVQARVVQGGFTFDKVAVGDDFSCGIDATAKTLRCWGRNGARELGNGGQTETSQPTAVIDAGASAKWKDLSLGLYSACGIQGPAGSTDVLGDVRCWGDNDFGQRGDGTFVTPTSGPTTSVLDTAFAVDTGHEFSCAIVGDPVAGGRVKCWGDNADGQLGTGVAGDHRRPVRVGEAVRGTRTWVAVAAGRRHTCAILGGSAAPNELYCWGENSEGQIDGTESTLPKRSPQHVPGMDGVTDVVVGSSHTCARLGSGKVMCFGSDQGYQLGVVGNQSPGPTVVYDTGGGFFPTGLVGSGNVTCATNPAGPQCWGSPEFTNAYYVNSETPVTVSLNGGVFPNASFSAGPNSGCWIEGAQTLCYGTNSSGQLGWGMSMTPTTQPQPVMGLTDATSLSRGPSNHRCAITTNRVVKCWGANGANQAGVADIADKTAPVTVQTPNQYDSVVTGESHTCALDGGAIFCWGGNDQFQRTAIATVSSLPPMSILAPVGEAQPGYLQLASGETHVCAISTPGVLYCWGGGRWGQIGDGTGSEAVAAGIIDGTP